LQVSYAGGRASADTERLFGLIVDLTKNALPRQHLRVAKYGVPGRKLKATHGYELCALARRK
jgi:hypothetical protein